MKYFTLKSVVVAAMMFILCVANVFAQSVIPLPASMTRGEGTFTFTEGMNVSALTLSDAARAEVVRFAEIFARTSGLSLNVVDAADAPVEFRQTDSTGVGSEGYKLDVTAEKITISSHTPHGFFNAIQTLKRLLPLNVMAGVADARVRAYTVPAVSIADRPRFGYRGFLLDVSRHFFTIDEVKRIIDLMAYYKLNRFHWHLTDDNGWRVEIKKYPLLTSVGSVRTGSYDVDPVAGRYYDYTKYGPYFYTQEQIREVVAYAAERHIEVLPEVDMPGHFAAAMTAYPEYSCYPYGSHNVWNDAGISTDVLNVANPAAVRFAKDILDELVELFPYPYIHIGGDEVPTTAWQNNKQCQDLLAELGATNYRELQSHFTHEITQYMMSKADPSKRRRVIVWNETITEAEANINLIKNDSLTIMCWNPADAGALKAAQNGMNNIVTPQRPYYINRKQSNLSTEPYNAGDGSDSLTTVYAYMPIPTTVDASLHKYYTGVQATCWTEHISSNYLLEYAILPRLMAIAETAWTPQSLKNFSSFRSRLQADSVLLNYGGYAYAKHYFDVVADTVMPKADTWYRMTIMATDTRAERCVQLIAEGSPLLTTYSRSAVGLLWSNNAITDSTDAHYNYQMWKFVESPTTPGLYALVCKALPGGSVNPTASAANISGRWSYAADTVYYNFILGDRVFTPSATGNGYSIRSDKYPSTYMIMGTAGQQFAINLFGNPALDNGGVFALQDPKATSAVEEVVYDSVMNGHTYIIESTNHRFAGLRLVDNGTSATLRHAAADYLNDAWTITEATQSTDGVQSAKLTNASTGRSISTVASPTTLSAQAATINITNVPTASAFTISSTGGAKILPIAADYPENPGTFYSSATAVEPQGIYFSFTPAAVITYVCSDAAGREIGRYSRASALGSTFAPQAPIIPGYRLITDLSGIEAGTVSAARTVALAYQRENYVITLHCTAHGGLTIKDTTLYVPVSAPTYTWAAPAIEWYSYSSSATSQTLTLSTDSVISLVYTTEALPGFAALGEAVSEVKNGGTYLLYNASTVENGVRKGFLNIDYSNRRILTSQTTSGSPLFAWTLEQSDDAYKVRNSDGLYVPQLPRGGFVTASADADLFTLAYDGTSWSIKGSNDYYFNGNAGSLTGWNGGHPFQVYEFVPKPYFSITYNCVNDEDGATIGLGTYTVFLPAGSTYILAAPVGDTTYPYATTTDPTLSGTLDRNISVTYTYSRTSTSITSATTSALPAKGIYDTLGRKRTTPTPGEVLIIDGRKTVVR